MKSLRLLGMFLLCAGACAAQEERAPTRHSPPGLVIVKHRWERQAQFPRNWDRPIYDAGLTSAGPRDSTRDAARQIGGGSPFLRGGRRPHAYHYSAGVRNDGAKKIKGLIWEYIFVDPESKKELGRHKFYSADKIGARKSKTLRGSSVASPSRTVSAAGLGKDRRSPYDERVEFRCVLYDDGTVWRHPSVEESECAELTDRRKMRRRTWMGR